MLLPPKLRTGQQQSHCYVVGGTSVQSIAATVLAQKLKGPKRPLNSTPVTFNYTPMSVRQISGPLPADTASVTGAQSGATASVNGTATAGDSRIGVILANQYNTLADSTIEPVGYSTGVVINNGRNQTLRDVVINSYGNLLSTGVAAIDTLNNCRMSIHMLGGATGLSLVEGGTVTSTLNGIDFVDGSVKIGNGNVIHLTTSNETVVKARLPHDWTTTAATTTNEIVIDGIRYYPPPPPP